MALQQKLTAPTGAPGHPSVPPAAVQGVGRASTHLFQLPGVEDSWPEPWSSSRTWMAASGLMEARRSRQVSLSGPVIVMCPILRLRRVVCLPYQWTLASGTCTQRAR